LPRGGEQAVHDGLRGVGDGKHAAIRLGLERDAACGEPFHRVARGKSLERAEQGAFAARIARGEFARLEAGVGDVAAATAGDADFVEAARGFFEDGHARTGFGGGDGGKESGCAAADHDDNGVVHFFGAT
jgi:hypothetical protein